MRRRTTATKRPVVPLLSEQLYVVRDVSRRQHLIVAGCGVPALAEALASMCRSPGTLVNRPHSFFAHEQSYELLL